LPKKERERMLTDRDVLIAIIRAIGGLGKRLTGESLVVECCDEEGNIYRTNADDGRIAWVKQEAKARSDDPAELDPTRS
jgi:hypothetical protein